MQARIDTLTKANTALTASNKTLSTQSDSLSKELEKYFGLYTVIKDKVVKKEFDPVKMTNIIDSFRSGRDSLTLNAARGALLGDSLKALIKVNDSLSKENTGLLYAVKLLKGGTATSPTDFERFCRNL